MEWGKFKDIPNNLTWWFTWGWVLCLASWGGAISYFHKLDTYGFKFSMVRLVIDVFTSAFVGVLTYLFCDTLHIPTEVTAAMVGISGHMGTRALFILERKYEKMFGAGNQDGPN